MKKIMGSFLLLIFSLGCSSSPKGSIRRAVTNCPAPVLSSDDQQPVGVLAPLTDKHPAYLSIDGSMVTPYGQTIATCTFPDNGAISPDGTQVALVCNGNRDIKLKNQSDQSVRIIDIATMQQKKVIELPNAFYGVTYTHDGKQLIVSGGLDGIVYRFDVKHDYAPLPRLGGLSPNTAGIVAPDNYPAIFVAESAADMVAMVDPVTGNIIRQFPTCRFPFDLVKDEAKSNIYFSCAMDDRIGVIDYGGGPAAIADIQVGYIKVGLNPTAMAVGPDSRLWVVISGEDKLAVVDPDAKIVTGRVGFFGDSTPLGQNLTDVAVSRDGKTAWVSLGTQNALAVVDTKALKVDGYIPTAWYPIWVAQSGDNQLLVASAKGFGTGPNAFGFNNYKDVDGDGTRTFFGTLSKISLTGIDLPKLTTQVEENNTRQSNYFSATCDTPATPVPWLLGQSSPIKHVVYIIKENKTYDVYLGDMAKDKWHKPEYAIFGEKTHVALARPAGIPADAVFDVTPNLHKIARGFSSCLNFYDLSDKSTQGHLWLTTGTVTDMEERLWMIADSRSGGLPILPGIDPMTRPATGDIFEALKAAGHTVRDYGEYAATARNMLGSMYDNMAFDYPFGITMLDDSIKVKAFIKDVDNGMLKDFTWMWVANDHTFGLEKGRLHPAYMVADNDHATGMIVDAISHSPFWDSTVIFILEDDPQNTPDHIDSHRSILLAVGPYVKRGYTSKALYSQANVHATMFRILGTKPNTTEVARATPMYDLFTNDPDFTPYDCQAMDKKFADRSKWIVKDTTRLDKMTKRVLYDKDGELKFDDADGLGAILWWTMKGLKSKVPPRLMKKLNDAMREVPNED